MFEELIGHQVEKVYLSIDKDLIIFEVSTGHARDYLYQVDRNKNKLNIALKNNDPDFASVKSIAGIAHFDSELVEIAENNVLSTSNGDINFVIGNNNPKKPYANTPVFRGHTDLQNNKVSLFGQDVSFREVTADF